MHNETRFEPTGEIRAIPEAWVHVDRSPESDGYLPVTYRPGTAATYRALDDGTLWQGPIRERHAVQVLYYDRSGEHVLMRQYLTSVTSDGEQATYNRPEGLETVLTPDPGEPEPVDGDDHAELYREVLAERYPNLEAATGQAAGPRPE